MPPASYTSWIDPIWIPDSYPKFGVLRFEAKWDNLLEYDSAVRMGWFTKKQRPKISCYCPFKIFSITKKPVGKKISNFKLHHGQKYAENCGSESLKLRTSEKIVIAEFRSCGCGATFLKKLRNCDCGLKNKLRVPTYGIYEIRTCFWG